MRTLRAAVLVFLAGSLLLGAPALAQNRDFNAPQGTGGAFGPPHVSGIRATVTDVTGLDVTINVTEMYVTNAAWTFGTAWIGVASTFGGLPLIPAVDWGDGSTIPFAGNGPTTGIPVSAYNTTVGGVPAHVYVGSFVHTYGAEGEYTITANSVNGVGTTAGQAPSPIITGSVVGSVTPTLGNTYYFVRNTTRVLLGSSPTIEIDTVSDLGLLLLALVLAASAVVMLKR